MEFSVVIGPNVGRDGKKCIQLHEQGEEYGETRVTDQTITQHYNSDYCRYIELCNTYFIKKIITYSSFGPIRTQTWTLWIIM